MLCSNCLSCCFPSSEINRLQRRHADSVQDLITKKRKRASSTVARVTETELEPTDTDPLMSPSNNNDISHSDDNGNIVKKQNNNRRSLDSLSQRTSIDNLATSSSIVHRSRTRKRRNTYKEMDWLLQLFRSGKFDTWMAVVFLHRYDNNPAVREHIVKQLSQLPEQELEFYLPQLCTLILAKLPPKSLLEEYLLVKCSESMHFGLRMVWLLEAVIEDKNSLSARAQEIREHVEQSAVNREAPGSISYNKKIFRSLLDEDEPSDQSESDVSDKHRFSISWGDEDDVVETALFSRPTKPSTVCSSNSIRDAADIEHKAICTETEQTKDKKQEIEKESDSSESPDSVDQVLDSYHVIERGFSKHRRCSLFNDEMYFVYRLLGMSADMRRIQPPEMRTKELRKALERFDHLRSRGTYVPLCFGTDAHSRVLRIVHEESVVFSSRERAPFCVFIETETCPFTCGHPDIDYLFGPSKDVDEDGISRSLSDSQLNTTVTNNTDVSNGQSKASENSDGTSTTKSVGDDFVLVDKAQEELPLRKVYGELFEEKAERIRKNSAYGHLPNWRLMSMIVKEGDDIRQEELAMQLIRQFKYIFDESGVLAYLRPYHILVTSANGGLIETITDAVSLDALKKKYPNYTTLADYFKAAYPTDVGLLNAKKNFVESMAGYSIVTYLLQIKDRHNGNLMLTSDGHIVHIDFGFMLSNSPGSINFESAPFKLTQEMVDVMGGTDSDMFAYFRSLVVQGFLAARRHMEKIVTLVELLLPGANLPCFVGNGELAVQGLRERFHLSLREEEFRQVVDNLINESIDNWRTRQYDAFQRLTNGIL